MRYTNRFFFTLLSIWQPTGCTIPTMHCSIFHFKNLTSAVNSMFTHEMM